MKEALSRGPRVTAARKREAQLDNCKTLDSADNLNEAAADASQQLTL